MKLEDILQADQSVFRDLPKPQLIDCIIELRAAYTKVEAQQQALSEENAKLRDAIQQQSIKEVNSKANQPSSKQAEWEEKPNGENPDKKKKRARKPRAGAGNTAKNRQPDREEVATLDQCDLCGKDLSKKDALESSNERVIEDIPDPVETTEVVKVLQEKKYCDECQQIITAKSDLALPGADIGLNASVLICYLWVALCLPYPKIKDYLSSFF
jgi:hypothetical protein